jgi:hypothetical protein
MGFGAYYECDLCGGKKYIKGSWSSPMMYPDQKWPNGWTYISSDVKSGMKEAGTRKGFMCPKCSLAILGKAAKEASDV